MDHLQTSQERQDRWYARHISPRYLPVVPAQSWDDLWAHENGDDSSCYETCVYAVPLEWLLPNDENEPTSTIHQNHPGDSSKALQKTMDIHGFVVVTGVLDETECRQARTEAWDWLEAASQAERALQCNNNNHNDKDAPVDRHDPSTLSSIYFPRSVEGGMMPFYGSGHSRLAWTVRSNDKVQSVFQALYHDSNDDDQAGNTNLLSSLDGIVLWRGGSRFRTDPGWFHLDQNPRHKPHPAAFQGLVNLSLPTTGPHTGGNALVPQSHKLFPHHYTHHHHACSDFYRKRLDELSNDDDWLEIDPHDDQLLSLVPVIACQLKAGDMLLWDSRTVHCSFPAADGTNHLSREGTLIRAATVVSMMPASQVSPAVIEARRQAVQQSRTLTHWVDKVAPLGEEHPDHVAREAACVAFMKEHFPNVLMGLDDLTREQMDLLVGRQGHDRNNQG